MDQPRTERPKVFISHSSEDKVRFVIDFATRLRSNGVDAWLDLWEMLPGDSLIDRIWNQGLRNCDAMIVVLSHNSIKSRWVREELDTGMVKKIQDNTRLLPVRLDQCEVPECLRATIWEDIADLASYDAQFERIVNGIYGLYSKPPLLQPPPYVQENIQVQGLTLIDSAIFNEMCEATIEHGDDIITDINPVVERLKARGISEDQILETEEILEGRGYIKLHRVCGPVHPYGLTVKPFGFERFAKARIRDYTEITKDVARRLVRSEHLINSELANAMAKPRRLVDHILMMLEQRGFVEVIRAYGAGYLHMEVVSISPELRRAVQQE